MKVAVLFSGGKDSCRTVHWCLEKKYDVKLVSMISKNPESWMYHTPNIHLVETLANAMNLPIIMKDTFGVKEEEVKDLKNLLRLLDVEGVACGGIASNYQKERIKKVCENLGLEFIAPFFGTNQEKFMRDTIDLGFDVRIIGVYADGFTKNWLGKQLNKKTLEELKGMNKKYKISLVGEGGEFETLVVDGPIFHKKIQIVDSKIFWDKKTSSGYLKIKKMNLS